MSEKLSKMRERQAYFSSIARKYDSFEAFVKENEHWLDMVGIDLIKEANCLTLYIQLDCIDYEAYCIIYGQDGYLTVSDIVGFQDDCCANRLLNIKIGQDTTEEKDITK